MTTQNAPVRTCGPACARGCKWAGMEHLGDPVADFFANLPSLLQHHQKGIVEDWKDSQKKEQVRRAVSCFRETSTKRQSADPDLLKLLKLLRCAPYPVTRYDHKLVGYVIQRPEINAGLEPRDKSLKARFLEYYMWISQGRKDATAPLVAVRGHPVLCKSLGRLPVGRKYSWCGLEANGLKGMEHPNTDVRHLYRAYSMFEVAFELFLIHLYPGWTHAEYYGDIKPKVSDVNGIVVVDFNSRPKTASVLDRTTQRAMLMFMSCELPARGARALLEMFIRPVCKRMEFLRITTRNVARAMLQIENDEEKPVLNTIVSHCVVLVELDCGLQFILDPTASQYGWSETILPFDIFRKYRMTRELHEPDPPDKTRCIWQDVLGAITVQTSSQIQQRYHGGITEIFNLPDPDQFLSERTAILQTMGRAMEYFGTYNLGESSHMLISQGIYQQSSFSQPSLYAIYKAHREWLGDRPKELGEWKKEWDSCIRIWDSAVASQKIKQSAKEGTVEVGRQSRHHTVTILRYLQSLKGGTAITRGTFFATHGRTL
ncbi:hypothetical protein B0T21DRAFT_407732 [Apiosordaria backusii]|uniref:Uncharacterized protein n=1 Tax=Apiosordaria backusii TaxID=314023 RepID=A0AA40ESL0_9PEZI|nr:hypothetical protein B0T21DRAFT_407732 [Apiosordaria backusii]